MYLTENIKKNLRNISYISTLIDQFEKFYPFLSGDIPEICSPRFPKGVKGNLKILNPLQSNLNPAKMIIISQ